MSYLHWYLQLFNYELVYGKTLWTQLAVVDRGNS